MARGIPEWLTALQRTDSPRVHGVTQSHVQLSGDPADTSIRRIKIYPIEAAQAQERSTVTCTPGKLLCTACYLVVCLSTREAGRDAEVRISTDQAGQSKRRDRLQLGTRVHADDPRAYRTPVGDLAEFGRGEPLARVGVLCQRHPTRQGSGACRIDAALESRSSRRACEPAQTH